MVKKYNKKSFKKSNKALVSTIKKVINKETEGKRIDFVAPTYLGTVTTTWAELSLLPSISSGTSYNQRVGTKVSVKAIEINMVLSNFNNTLVTSDNYNVCRFVMGVYDGSSTTPLGTALVGINTPVRDYNVQPLHYLMKQKYINLVPSSGLTTTGGPALHIIKIYHKFKKPMIVNYANNVPDKSVVISMLSDTFAAPNPGIINGWVTVHYTDF